MLVEGLDVDQNAVLPFDVCIVGAGPAGLALAAELDGGSARVCVIESGGATPDEAVQRLGEAVVDLNEDGYTNPTHQNARALGGTAHRWCVEVGGESYFRVDKLTPGDFTARSWLPNSGWPIDAAALDPYYQRALARCGVDRMDIDTDAWSDQRHQPIESASGRLESRVFLFGRRRVFVQDLPDQLAASTNVTVFTGATCVELESRDNGKQVTRARIRTLDGRQFRITSRAVVLAQGSFEVPRLLLASRGEVEAGLGNHHGLVGRYLTDHQIVKAGSIVSSPPGLAARLAYYDLRTIEGVPGSGRLSLAEKTLEDEKILASAIMVVPRPAHSMGRAVQHLFGRETTSRSSSIVSAYAFRRAITTRIRPDRPFRQLSNLVTGADDLVYSFARYQRRFAPRFSIDNGGWSDGAIEPRAVKVVEAYQLCEQAPDPDNRVTLSEQRDALGMPKLAVNFVWRDLDRYSAATAQQIFSDELGAAGVGVLEFPRRDGEPVVRQMSAHHPAGTTRMSASPRKGVVDAQCRVHGMSNLFVASASTFPTCGYGPPTLTIVAMAIRLADHLGVLLAAGDLPRTS